MRLAYYRGSIDGDIKKYLQERHNDGSVAPTFIGFAPFKQIWDLGVIEPHIATIRLMHDQGWDEHYVVVDETQVEGIALITHAGKPGLHNTQELLTTTMAPYWEIQNLNPKVYHD